MIGMVYYETFSERPEQKTPNSIHKMVPHGKWAFTKEVEEKGNVTGKNCRTACNRGHVGHAEWTTRT